MNDIARNQALSTHEELHRGIVEAVTATVLRIACHPDTGPAARAVCLDVADETVDGIYTPGGKPPVHVHAAAKADHVDYCQNVSSAYDFQGLWPEKEAEPERVKVWARRNYGYDSRWPWGVVTADGLPARDSVEGGFASSDDVALDAGAHGEDYQGVWPEPASGQPVTADTAQ